VYRRHSRTSKTTKIKNMRKHKNKHKLIEAQNKHQTETENNINREINELRMKIDNIKEEVTHDMKNLRTKNETEKQNKKACHSCRLEQEEDRISEHKDEMKIKGKTEEL
jgi:hypothetical protein